MTDQGYKLVAGGPCTSTHITGVHLSVPSNYPRLGLWEHDKRPEVEGEVNPALHRIM